MTASHCVSHDLRSWFSAGGMAPASIRICNAYCQPRSRFLILEIERGLRIAPLGSSRWILGVLRPRYSAFDAEYTIPKCPTRVKRPSIVVRGVSSEKAIIPRMCSRLSSSRHRAKNQDSPFAFTESSRTNRPSSTESSGFPGKTLVRAREDIGKEKTATPDSMPWRKRPNWNLLAGKERE